MLSEYKGGYLLLVALVLLTFLRVSAAQGVDEVLEKPDSEMSWGRMAAGYFDIRNYSRSYALVIGISQYDHDHFHDLPTQNDAIMVANHLFEIAGFDYVHLLTEDQVTIARVRELLDDEFPEMIDGNDRFLLYWSGHGVTRELSNGTRGYFPVSSSRPRYYSSMVSMDDIHDWNQVISADQAVLILDSCFSGLAGSVPMSTNFAEVTLEHVARPSRHLITAGTGGEQTFAADRLGGSVFRAAFLDGIRGEADSANNLYPRDGVVTLGELLSYIRTRIGVASDELDWPYPLTPQIRDLGGSQGEFFFVTADYRQDQLRARGETPHGSFRYGQPIPMSAIEEPTTGSSTAGGTPSVGERSDDLFGGYSSDGCGTPSDTDEMRLTIGTGGVTGVYYPTGGAIQRLVAANRDQHGLRVTVESTGGSVYNLNDIGSGQLDMGVVQSDWQFHSYNGSHGNFAEANDELRTVFAVHPEPLTVIARADSGIRSLSDIPGHRVNIGNPGSGARATFEVLMSALDWTEDDFSQVYELPLRDQSQALCDDLFDVAVFTVGHPSGTIQEVTTNCDTTIVEIAGPEVDALVAENSYYSTATIPGGMYEGTLSDVPTFGVRATFVASSDVPEYAVCEVVRSVFDNFEVFQRLHPAFANLSPDDMVNGGLSAPMHPGALRYLDGVGIEVPDRLRP